MSCNSIALGRIFVGEIVVHRPDEAARDFGRHIDRFARHGHKIGAVDHYRESNEAPTESGGPKCSSDALSRS